MDITPMAAAIFRKMAKLDCTCALSVEDGSCPGCLEFKRLDSDLRRELQLMPWQWPTFPKLDETESPYQPGTEGHEWFPHAIELRKELAKAARVRL
jgi:hypothetical protein